MMAALYPDTHPKMEALQIQLWREASPTLRTQYPQATEAEIQRRLADVMLGETLASKVCGEASYAK